MKGSFTGMGQERMRGVFSLQEVRKVGTGTTTRKTVMKTFWFVDQDDQSGEIMIQSLNHNYVPTGPIKAISREELLEKYSPELEFYVQTVFPKMREISETVDAADAHREKNELFSAEFEYSNALELDVENVRANFGIGLTYLAQGDKEKAESILSRLVTLDAAFQKEHKHLFNEFGINLRKSQMYDKALEYYEKAIDLGKEDPNLFLNIARVYIEAKDYMSAVITIRKALAIDSRNEVAIKMLTWMAAKGFGNKDEINEILREVQ